MEKRASAEKAVRGDEGNLGPGAEKRCFARSQSYSREPWEDDQKPNRGVTGTRRT